MSVPKDIEAEIYFLSTAEGGRSTPAFTGYRPLFRYNEQDWISSHFYPDVEAAEPGETVRAYIGLLSPDEHLGKIQYGVEFIVREGNRTVGKGVVTKIIELENLANHVK